MVAKTSGINVRLFQHGRDLSGDANALTGLSYVDELQDITALDKQAMARQKGRTDGKLGINAWFDSDDDHAHDAWTANSGKLPTADQLVMVPFGTSIGDQAAMLRAKMANHEVNRTPSGAVAASAELQANDFGLEFGLMLTPGKETHGSATNNASVDGAAASAAGAVAQQQVMSVATGTMVGAIQDSADNVSFAAITGLTFAGVATAGAPTAERLATAAGATIRRYVRFASTGTFTNAVLAAAFKRG